MTRVMHLYYTTPCKPFHQRLIGSVMFYRRKVPLR